MEVKQAIEKFRNESIAINVQTESEWEEFMELLEYNSDLSWLSGRKLTNRNLWHMHNLKSCIFTSTNGIACVNKEECDSKIITFQDFKKLYQKENDMKQFTKSDLKDYMKVVQRDGVIYIKKGRTLSREGGLKLTDFFKENLTSITSKELDIVEVYEPTLGGWNLLWKREEPKYYLMFPAGMFGTDSKLVKFCEDYDWVDISYDNSEKAKVEFTQEEIDEIPFNTDMFTPVPV